DYYYQLWGSLSDHPLF
nr:immunoglobulin light chain junction region [Macaca mulatta]